MDAEFKLTIDENPIVQVIGEKGIGKTTYVADYFKRYQGDAVIRWVSATKKPNFNEFLSDMAGHRIAELATPIERRCALSVYAGRRPTYFVIDNFQDVDHEIFSLEIGNCSSNVKYILITPEVIELNGLYYDVFKIPHMNENDAQMLASFVDIVLIAAIGMDLSKFKIRERNPFKIIQEVKLLYRDYLNEILKKRILTGDYDNNDSKLHSLLLAYCKDFSGIAENLREQLINNNYNADLNMMMGTVLQNSGRPKHANHYLSIYRSLNPLDPDGQKMEAESSIQTEDHRGLFKPEAVKDFVISRHIDALLNF
jgi:hypothetical protein